MHRRESGTWGKVTEDDYRQSRACYYAYIEQLDAQIGRILEALDETGQAENTMVTFTTDHGDMCGNHRMWIKGWIPYEETYRVPMIARWPGHIQPVRRPITWCKRMTWRIHMLQAASAKALPFADGRALQPLFSDPRIEVLARSESCARTMAASSCIRSASPSPIVSSTFSTGSISTSCMTCETIRKRCTTRSRTRSTARYADDMRARLYEMMNAVEDPYGTPTTWHRSGNRPDNYGAPRYLARGKRLIS